MRLFEAILEANHRAGAGDEKAGLHPAEFADALPVAALTCIDARLNPLIPEVLDAARRRDRFRAGRLTDPGLPALPNASGPCGEKEISRRQ